MDNSWTGSLCFVALVSPMPSSYGVLSTVGLLTSTLAAHSLGAPADSIQHGLYGFNGMLCGAAIATFTDSTGSSGTLALHVILAFAAAALSTLFSLALSGAWIRTFNVPTFTMPFNIATLATLSAVAGAYASSSSQDGSGLRLFVLSPGLGRGPSLDAASRLGDVLANATSSAPTTDVGRCFNPGLPTAVAAGVETGHCVSLVLASILRGVSQVYFNDRWESGLALVLAFAICSPIGAACAVIGSSVGLGVGVLLGASPEELSAGLWGFNAVIGAMAIPVFYRFSARACVSTVACAATCALLRGSWAVVLSPMGLPGLTLPFCTGALVGMSAWVQLRLLSCMCTPLASIPTFRSGCL